MGKLIPNALNLWVVIFVALGSTASSYGMAVIGSTIGQPSFYDSLDLAPPGAPGYDQTANWLGAFNGLSSAGSAVGALASSWFSDRYSRKKTLQSSAVILIVGAALCAGSVNSAMFLVGRLINGLGIGALVTVIPVYQAEIATAQGRGFMVSMHGVMFALGYSLSSWLGFGFYFYTNESTASLAWRFPVMFQSLPALILLIGSPWIPYSPRWLMMNDRCDEAFDVLRRLHTTKDGENDDFIQEEYDQVRGQIQIDNQKGSRSTWELFKTPAYRRRSLIAFLLMWNNQYTGVLVINNYMVLLLTCLGLDGYRPLLLSAVYVFLTFPGNIFCGLYVERFGRRTFLLIGLIGIALVLSIETALQAQFLGTDNRTGQSVAVLFIFLFAVPFWSFFIDATQFVYLAEIFPTNIRSQGVGLGMAGYYLANIVLLLVGPIALDNIQWRFFLVFITVTAANVAFVYFMCPETKGLSLEEIAIQFGEEVVSKRHDVNDGKSELDPEVAGAKPGAQDRLQNEKLENSVVHQEHGSARSDGA